MPKNRLIEAVARMPGSTLTSLEAARSVLWEWLFGCVEDLLLKRKIPEVLYHYTSCEAAMKILGSRYIHATGLRSQSDPSEGLYACAEMARSLRRVGGNVAPRLASLMESKSLHAQLESLYFVVCFCTDVDSPELWNRYAGESTGCAIGFRTRDLLDESANVMRAMPIHYSADHFSDIVVSIVRHAESEISASGLNDLEIASFLTACAEILAALAPQFKSKEYEREQEWRVLCWNPKHVNAEVGSRTVNWREAPIQFINIAFPGSALVELVGGSRSTPTHVVQLQNLLAAYGSRVELRRSQVKA